MFALSLASVIASVAAAKAKVEEAAGSPILDALQAMATDIYQSTLGLAQDVAGLTLAAPRFSVDVYMWAVAHVRSAPTLAVKVYNGDDSTMNDFTSFAVYAAGVIFCVYVGVVALNLVLVLFTSVKDYFQGYLVLPTKIPIINQKLPELLMALRDDLQVEVFDRVRTFKCDKWIIPLEGQTGKPSLKGAVASLAMAMSACMMLSCAPAIHALVKSGADKAGAEAIAYTVGTALGLQYLAKQAA